MGDFRRGAAVVVARLHKSYGRLEAVRNLSFVVETGTVFSFLGANGAGKTTTIGCITTTLSPTFGTIMVDGVNVQQDPRRVRQSIGAVFQHSLLDPTLSVRDNLTIRAGFYGMSYRTARSQIARLSELVGMSSFLERRYGQLSGGQKRRADIARALIHKPSVIFLDEPTAGLDPQSREQIWSAIHELRRYQGTTVFLTTHYMEETEHSDQVCIINQGSIVAQGTPAELRARFSSSILTVRSTDPENVRYECLKYGFRAQIEAEDIIIPVDSATTAHSLLSVLKIDDFEFRHGTMDDVFLAVTGRGAE